MAERALDWTAVYADARIAFPAGVRIRTDEPERGGVQIVAVEEFWWPPLPLGMVPPAEPAGGCLLSYADDDDGTVAHRLERRYVAYTLLDSRVSAQVARHAARKLAAKR